MLLANTPAQAKFSLNSLEQAARSIGLYMNLDKTELMYLNRGGTLWKLTDQFIYLSSNISSTENDVNICGDKAWIVIDTMKIWSPWLNKTRSLPRCSHVSTTVWYHRFSETFGEKAWWTLHKDVAYCFEQQHPSKPQLYGNLPPISQTIQEVCWALLRK